MITWGKDISNSISGMEEDLTAVLNIKTLFWDIFTVEGTKIASGAGANIESSKYLIEQTMREILGRKRIDKGSYPPGVPNGGESQ